MNLKPLDEMFYVKLVNFHIEAIVAFQTQRATERIPPKELPKRRVVQTAMKQPTALTGQHLVKSPVEEISPPGIFE
jgi:hypothetical protein